MSLRMGSNTVRREGRSFNEGQKICGDFSGTAPLQRYTAVPPAFQAVPVVVLAAFRLYYRLPSQLLMFPRPFNAGYRLLL